MIAKNCGEAGYRLLSVSGKPGGGAQPVSDFRGGVLFEPWLGLHRLTLSILTNHLK